ncbi:prepilin peptidase [Streptococcus zalophi]|uniref:Prepilin peptidase n=1 Tax=Streptococcus zalophi TaxID=640031 RepID=A0A934PA37_9STRE|nr:prepilin peptidase [Streptococcus zalophi]MBJ8349867.1 prepilin peptidase [Streptococcus zalophi]MCR8967634.1 prepilin peptidase [Streptococcus zalophi]
MTYFTKQLHHWQKGLITKKTKPLKLKMDLLMLFAGLIITILAYKWTSTSFTNTHIAIIGFSLLLSFYDIFYQEYPLIIWMILTLSTLLFYPITLTAFILFLLALLAEFRDIKIGSGDLFYLSTISLTITIWQLSWLIQLASLMGIVVIFLSHNNKKIIAFIPFLTLAYCLVL